MLAALVFTETMDEEMQNAQLEFIPNELLSSINVHEERSPNEIIGQTHKVVFPEEALPISMVLSCGGGGSIMAAEGILEVRAGMDEDWRAVECTRANTKLTTQLKYAFLGESRCV